MFVYAVNALMLKSGTVPAMHAMALCICQLAPRSGSQNTHAYVSVRFAASWRLLVIAVDYGGIMPCLIAFVGEQFVLHAQRKRMIGFFAIFYNFLIISMLVAVFLLPIVLSYIICFGGQCYALIMCLPLLLLAILYSGSSLRSATCWCWCCDAFAWVYTWFDLIRVWNARLADRNHFANPGLTCGILRSRYCAFIAGFYSRCNACMQAAA